MDFYNVEELILDMADLVLEVRKLRAENRELREYKERNDKRLSDMVSQNFKTSAELINNLLRNGDKK